MVISSNGRVVHQKVAVDIDISNEGSLRNCSYNELNKAKILLKYVIINLEVLIMKEQKILETQIERYM